MAQIALRLDTNIPGELFVDSTCIDCDACWYSWDEQIRSMERLLDYSFEWVLPGHGRPIHLSRDEMRKSLETCVEWMKT